MDVSLFIKALSETEKQELKYLLDQELGYEPLEKPFKRMTVKQWVKRHPTMSTRIKHTLMAYSYYMDEWYDMDEAEFIKIPQFGKVSRTDLKRFMAEDKEKLEAIGIKTGSKN